MRKGTESTGSWEVRPSHDFKAAVTTTVIAAVTTTSGSVVAKPAKVWPMPRPTSKALYPYSPSLTAPRSSFQARATREETKTAASPSSAVRGTSNVAPRMAAPDQHERDSSTCAYARKGSWQADSTGANPMVWALSLIH